MNRVKVGPSIDELFFIISPPPHIKSDVSVLKDDVQYLIGHHFDDRYAKAHISLFKFDVEEHFDDITRHVEEVAGSFSPFNIFIKDLNVFFNGPHRTIFLDIMNKYPVREIFEKLVKKDVQYVPTITIARKLTAEDFLKAWPYLKDLPYNQHFLCDRITVLARIEEKWITYKEILFGQ
jgi:2'-5' RNA ligase